MKTAFIQIRPDGQILNQGNYTAYYGFMKLGYKTILYSSALDYTKKLEVLPLPVAAGGIDTLRQIFLIIILYNQKSKNHTLNFLVF